MIRSVVIPCLALAFGGCLEAEDDVVQFAEDFEDGIEGWTASGELGVVTTNHPGEHALWLTPGASITHPLDITRAIDIDESPYGDGFTDGNWVEYSGDCGGRPALALEPTTEPPGSLVRVRLVLEGPPRDAFTRTKLMFPALPPFIPAPDDDEDPYAPNDPPDVRFTSLVVAAQAPCHLDNLRLMVSGGTLGY